MPSAPTQWFIRDGTYDVHALTRINQNPPWDRHPWALIHLRGDRHPFGIDASERDRHPFVIGGHQ